MSLFIPCCDPGTLNEDLLGIKTWEITPEQWMLCESLKFPVFKLLS